MPTFKTITNDLTAAMKQKDSFRVSVLRLLVSVLTNEKIALRRELNETEITALLQKEVRKRQEAAGLYEQGKRPELAAKEKEEIKIVQAYLPQMLAKEELVALIGKMKADSKLPADFGGAMKAVMAAVNGRADGRQVAELVKVEL